MFAPKVPKKFKVSLFAAWFQEGSVGEWVRRAVNRAREKRS